MTRARFETLLDTCTAAALNLARTMVTDTLPAEVRYQTFGERGVLSGREMTRSAFIDHFFADGRVPRWIDLSVAACTPHATVIGVWHASDTVEDEPACTYSSRGQGPFGVKGPLLPPGWESIDKSGRFSLSSRRANKSPETTRGTGL